MLLGQRLLIFKVDPVTTGSRAFSAPDWILGSRDGSNPKTWSSDLIYSDTSPTSVLGRYAYTIYDEGGLLDMTVAGYPSGTTAEQAAYKTSLAYADLTQLGLTQSQIDSIISWRSAHPFTDRQSLINYLT